MEEYVGEKLRIYFKPELLNRIRSKNHELGRPTCAAPSGPEAMAFVLPNDNHCGREYGDYLTAIDDIGVALGSIFLPPCQSSLGIAWNLKERLISGDREVKSLTRSESDGIS